MEAFLVLFLIAAIVIGICVFDSSSKKAKRRHYAKYNVISAPEEKGLLADMVSDFGVELGDPEWKNLAESRKITATLEKQNRLLSKIANKDADTTNSELHERIRQLEATVHKLQNSNTNG